MALDRTLPHRPSRTVAVVLTAVLGLGGCRAPEPSVTLQDAEPGPVATVRCVGPAVAGTTPLPADVTQASTSGVEFCVVGHGDASHPQTGTMITAVEFTVQNPGTAPVELPADAPVLQAAPYGPAAVVAPEGRVLPEQLGARSAVTTRVLYDYTAAERSGARLRWADLVVELPE